MLLLFSHSVVSDSATPGTAASQPSLSFTIEFAQTHVHWKSMMPSSHLTLCCPLFLLLSVFPSIRVFSNELTPHIISALAQPFHSFCSYFSALPQEHIGHLPTWGVHLSVSCLFAFSYCPWGSQGKNAEVDCYSLFQWTTFCQNSLPWPCLSWVALHGLAHSFIELQKAAIHVIILASFLWLCFSFCLPSDGWG